MVDFSQIGWFHPGSKRFCYDDEKVHFAPRKDDYTQPVFAIDPESAKRISVNIEAQNSSTNTPKVKIALQCLCDAISGMPGSMVIGDKLDKVNELIAQL